MTTQVQTNGGGSVLWGIAAVATVVLFVLQVIGTIHVSWWLVFAPLLAVLGFSLAMIVVALIVFGIGVFFVHRSDKKRVTYREYHNGRGYWK